MRCLILTLLVSCSVAAAAAAQDQPAPGPPSPAPAEPGPPAPAPAQGNTGPAARSYTDTSVSLFELLPNQFEAGGRWSSQAGDPARFQRYGDFGDGLLFNLARVSRAHSSGKWLFTGAADNAGWRDQRYAASYQRPGNYTVSGFWDQIPQFYSVDTMTPYVATESVLTLDDAAQLAAQTGQGLSVYVPIAPQFDLRERRDIGTVRATVTPTTRLDLTGAFTTQRHLGELPWGASFGFSNDVEVALPYESRANDLNLGAEWTNGRTMFRVAYDGSWFNNHSDELIWDSPLRLDDSTSAPGRGRMALWPSNSAQTFSAAGFAKFARRSQLTAAVSYGFWNNDEPLQPFTINAALPQLELPRQTAQAEARVFSTNLNFVSRPVADWSFGARLRRYDYDNKTGHVDIPEFINYDTSIKVSSTGGPEPYAHRRTNVDADATYRGLEPITLTFGYAHNATGHDFRIFESTGENVWRLAADAIGAQWVTFRFGYEHANRTGSGLNEDLLLQIGEQPAMRHFDIANRTRNRFSGQVDVAPDDRWILSGNFARGADDFDDSAFGLQESSFLTLGFAGDVQLSRGWGAGLSYNYERYDGLHRSRSANPGQETDPLRDWTADSEETVHYFALRLLPPRWGATEARLSWDYSYAEGTYFYAVVPGGPLAPPNQLPNVYNKLQQLHANVRHRLSSNLAGTLSYLYEPFRVYDFAFDPSVVNGIVQPSSLVMGYVYRPYTAHSVVVGLKYFW
jgi:MtrB/PioB family decaheme-associated outer membrane protein